jgi:hypothetical protein
LRLQAMLTTLTVPVLVAIYTWNYARWAAKRNLRGGAFGLVVLAVATVAVPVFVLWWLG